MRLEQSWLRSVPVEKVIGAIQAAGGEARFVGGCVRDALLQRELGDFDLATTLKPDAVQAACEGAGCKVVPTGLRHGTVTVIANGQVFEVTTLRRDVSTDGRWAEVEYTTDWQQDAARRDFTMNALYCAQDGEVTDFFGGVDDAKAGRVRFVGDAEKRIQEDVLRILRFFRFHAHYGQGAPDAEGLQACRRFMHLLPNLSAERIRMEFLKLLAAPDPVPGWQLMADASALRALQLPLANFARLELVARAEAAAGLLPDPIRRLWACLERDDVRVATRLRLSNKEAQRLSALMPLFEVPDDAKAQLRLAYYKGADIVLDALLASGKASAEAVATLQSWQRPQLPLNGADLMALGIPSGPRLGETMERVERWWVEHDFAPSHADCLAQAKG